MVLEYSGRHLAMIEAAAAVKLVLYFSLIIGLFVPFSIAGPDAGVAAFAFGILAYLVKLNVFAQQAVALALSVAWQALVQGAPHLLVTAAIALVVKGYVIPMALHQIIRRLQIHREVEQVIGAGPTMLTGLILVALSILLVQ